MKAFFSTDSRTDLAKLIDKINWLKAIGNYVVVDPNNRSLLLYLNPKAYNKLLVAIIAADKELMTLATPEDDESSVRARHSVSRTTDSGTPNLSDWMSKSSKLLSLISGWKVRDSMINFKRNFDKFMPSYYLDVASWLGLKTTRFSLRQIWKLSNSLRTFYRTRGINQVILKLKISQIVVLKYLAGERVSSTQDLGQRIKLVNGLPSWIPPYFRSFIRSGNIQQIRVIITLLSAYKGFQGKYGSTSFDSIQAPMPLLNMEEVWKNVKGFWDQLNVPSKSFDIYPSRDTRRLPLTVGPNSKISFLGAQWDAIAIVFGKDFEKWENYNDTIEAFATSKNIFANFRKDSLMRELWNTAHKFKEEIEKDQLRLEDVLSLTFVKELQYITEETEEIIKFQHWISSFDKKTNPPISWGEVKEFIIPILHTGKLAIKLEPAGKIRVFAIVDFWTQWFLLPLHDTLFEILRKHPCDATFDQIGKVREYADRNYRFHASYDLKSATDMIPNILYKIILSYPTSVETANSWVDLLVHRTYKYLSTQKDKTKVFQYIKYGRGQPMGALSSWAMLAVVHHFLVYMAAQRVGVTQFHDYMVLGDDIDIADKIVAQSYLNVCRDLDIPIGLPKSFVSEENRFFQFASQDMLDGINISPFSLREALAASANSYYFGKDFNLSQIVEFALRSARKGNFELMNFTSLLRAVCSQVEMKKNNLLLTQGIFPRKAQNYLVYILANRPESFTNTISLDQLIASIRGDIRLFSNHVNYSVTERNLYLRKLLTIISNQIRNDLSNFNRYSMPLDIISDKKVSPSLNELYRKAAVQQQAEYTESFTSIRHETMEIIKDLQGFISAQAFGLAITGENESRTYLTECNKFLRLLELQRNLKRLMIKRGLTKNLVNTLGTTESPYYLNLHMSILNESLFR